MLNFGAGDLEDMRCDWNLSVKMFTSARARVICALGSVRNLYEVWMGISLRGFRLHDVAILRQADVVEKR